ncbi:hypothetical protein [Amycolatopsis sp. NPDC004169]|uniref:hypothetical protein n=1 Tax=Amycolatopsis sp. NPDC004169 TaxID=3154453 RepID=UPI0033AD5944
MRQLTRWWVGVISPPAPSADQPWWQAGAGRVKLLIQHPDDLVGDVGTANAQPRPGEQPVLHPGELDRVDPGDREQRERLAHPAIMASRVRQDSSI